MVVFLSGCMQQYPFIFSNEWKYRLRRHGLFWFTWWFSQGLLYSFVNSAGPQPYPVQLLVAFTDSLIFMIVHIWLAYVLMYFIIPRLLLRARYWACAIAVVLSFLVAALISGALSATVIPYSRCMLHELYPGIPCQPGRGLLQLSMLGGLRGGLTVGGFAAAIKLMKYWYTKEQRNLQLQRENADSQLQLLKAQIHPHFLFNTLNNIYSYTQDTSPVASRLVGGLADILRFMLYESRQSLVPLAKELKLVQDYCELEKVRYDNKIDLHLDLPENTDRLYITPLLLLPLIENSFKHGASHLLDNPWISLHIRLQGMEMQMKLVNGKVPDLSSSDHSGIGIQNVRKRLELLYPGKHQLLITNEPDVFVVNLKIILQKIKEPENRTSYSLTV